MRRCILLLALSIFLAPSVWAQKTCCAKSEKSQTPKSEKSSVHENDELANLLSQMKKATEQLKSCQAELSHLFIQDPDLLDSKTLKNGTLYYATDEDRSRLRIQFTDIQQDDFEPVLQREEYLFDGVWMTRIDYKLKQVDQYQKAPEDDPIGVFELISHNFPLIGFSEIDELEKDFEVSLVKQGRDPNVPSQLLLKTRKNSKYHEEFSKIDFWVSKKTFLPFRIRAYTTQGDIHDIHFLAEKINKKLKNSVFTIETPAGFSQNREALKKESIQKGN